MEEKNENNRQNYKTDFLDVELAVKNILCKEGAAGIPISFRVYLGIMEEKK